MQTDQLQTQKSTHPPLVPMHLSFLFSGAATLLLGPTLPLFAAHWHLRDSQSGLLIASQFFGLFAGAIALSRNLRLTLLCGDITASFAFVALAVASRHAGGFHYGVFAFFLLGLGLGQITTTVNLLSARRFSAPRQRTAALSLLNFTWSAGAVLSPLLAGLFLSHASVFALLLAFSASALILFAVVTATVPRAMSSPSHVSLDPDAPQRHAISVTTLLYFMALFFFYGGLEATVSGWLSTYTLRYTSVGLAAAAYCTTAMWAAFAVGRALAAGLLRYWPEKTVRASGILLAAMAAIALRSVHSGPGIGACAAAIGLGIAPFFAITFSLLVAQIPSPRQAGAATANIGLGSAVFPYLTGLVSTRIGSLHTAMLTPVAIAFGVLLLCSIEPPIGKPALR